MRDIFDLLHQKDALTPEIINSVRTYCQLWGGSGFHALLETNVYSESELADVLATELSLDRIYEIFPKDRLDEETNFIPYKMAVRWEVFPIHSLHSDCLFEVIIADPTQRKRIDWMRRKTKNKISLAVGERRCILDAINRYYPISHQLFLEGETIGGA